MSIPVNARVRAVPNFLACLHAAHSFMQEQDAASASARFKKLQAEVVKARALLSFAPTSGRPARFLDADRELTAVGKSLQDQTGRSYHRLQDGARVSGVYRRSVQLASGRFAVLDDGLGFSLVPWRPVVERHLGKQASAVVRGSSVSWHFGRERGSSI